MMYSYWLIFKWANPGLFLGFFVLIKQHITEKAVGFSVIQTRIVGVEGEQAYH